jgi:hypothetical protein
MFVWWACINLMDYMPETLATIQRQEMPKWLWRTVHLETVALIFRKMPYLSFDLVVDHAVTRVRGFKQLS